MLANGQLIQFSNEESYVYPGKHLVHVFYTEHIQFDLQGAHLCPLKN